MRSTTLILYTLLFISLFRGHAHAQPDKISVSDAAAFRTVDSLNSLAFKVKRNDIDQALLLLGESANLALNVGYKKGLAVAYLNEAGIYQQHGYSEKAVSLYYKSLGISRDIKDTISMARASQQIGNALVESGDIAGAEKLFQDAMKSYLALGLKDDVVNIFNSLGLLEMTRKNYTASEDNFRNALHESQLNDYKYGLKKANFHIGLLYLQQNQLEQAKAYFNEALALDEKNNDKYGVSLAKNKLAQIANKERNYEKAIFLAEDALHEAEAIAASQLMIEAIENLILIYRSQDNFAQVIKWQDTLIALQKEVSEQEKSFGFSFLDMLEEKQASQLASEKQALQAEQKTEQMFQMLEFAGLAGIILLLLSYMWYKNYRKAVVFGKELAAKNEMIEKNALVLDTLNKNIIRQNEKLEEANSMKGKLFSIISHDLRGPIASVQGVLKLIGRKSMSEAEIKRILGMLGKEVDVVMDMLTNLLAWSRAQLQGSVVALEPTHVHLLAQENIALAAIEAHAKEIELINAIPEDTVIMADKERLNFVLRNLLMNAIKFTFAGGEVKVHLEEMEDTVAIVVKDNGQGIAPENIEKLFTDKRFTTTGTAKEKGTGLGLMFSRDFIEGLGGSIVVESKVGEGSSFYIHLPKSEVVAAEAGEAALV